MHRSLNRVGSIIRDHERVYYDEDDMQTEINGFIVTGTPGMGKSSFLIYELFRLQDKSVFVQLGQEDYLVFQPGKPVRKCSFLYQFMEYLDTCDAKNSFYLYDPLSSKQGPLNVYIKTIVFASPDKRNFGMVKKDRYRMLYMPVWSLDEIIECNELCYQSSYSKEKNVAVI